MVDRIHLNLVLVAVANLDVVISLAGVLDVLQPTLVGGDDSHVIIAATGVTGTDEVERPLGGGSVLDDHDLVRLGRCLDDHLAHRTNPVRAGANRRRLTGIGEGVIKVVILGDDQTLTIRAHAGLGSDTSLVNTEVISPDRIVGIEVIQAESDNTGPINREGPELINRRNRLLHVQRNLFTLSVVSVDIDLPAIHIGAIAIGPNINAERLEEECRILVIDPEIVSHVSVLPLTGVALIRQLVALFLSGSAVGLIGLIGQLVALPLIGGGDAGLVVLNRLLGRSGVRLLVLDLLFGRNRLLLGSGLLSRSLVLVVRLGLSLLSRSGVGLLRLELLFDRLLHRIIGGLDRLLGRLGILLRDLNPLDRFLCRIVLLSRSLLLLIGLIDRVVSGVLIRRIDGLDLLGHLVGGRAVDDIIGHGDSADRCEHQCSSRRGSKDALADHVAHD